MGQQQKHVRERDALSLVVRDARLVVEAAVQISPPPNGAVVDGAERLVEVVKVNALDDSFPAGPGIVGVARVRESPQNIWDAVFHGVYPHFEDAAEPLIRSASACPASSMGRKHSRRRRERSGGARESPFSGSQIQPRPS